MTLKPVGVFLTAEGQTEFSRAMQTASKLTMEFSKATGDTVYQLKNAAEFSVAEVAQVYKLSASMQSYSKDIASVEKELMALAASETQDNAAMEQKIRYLQALNDGLIDEKKNLVNLASTKQPSVVAPTAEPKTGKFQTVIGAIAALTPQGQAMASGILNISKAFELASKTGQTFTKAANEATAAGKLTGFAEGVKQAGTVIQTLKTGASQLLSVFIPVKEKIQETGQAIQNVTQSISPFTIALGNLISRGIESLVSGIGNTIKSFENYTQGAIEVSAQSEKMKLVLLRLGNQAGYTGEQVQEEVDKIAVAGKIQTNAAQEAVSQFLKMNIPLKFGGQLADVAKDYAQLSPQISNSSEMYQRFLWAISTGNTEILRTAGVTIDLAAATKKFGDDADVAGNKQKIMIKAILESGKSVAGAYDSASQSAAKIISSLERVKYEVQRNVGEPFQEAYLNWAKIQDTTTKGILAMVEKFGLVRGILDIINGLVVQVQKPILAITTAFEGLMQKAAKVTEAFYKPHPEAPVLDIGFAKNMNIGRIQDIGAQVDASIGPARQKVDAFSESISYLYRVLQTAGSEITKAIGSIFSKVTDGLSGKDAEMEQYGANSIKSFADGIIQATSYVIAAIQSIGEIISYFLQAASPPRILPDLTSWGTNAATAYMEGWKTADMSAFKEMSSSIQSALEIYLKPEEVIPSLWKIRDTVAQVMDTIQAGGTVGEAAFAEIDKAAGAAGKNISDLVRAYVNVNVAQKKLETSAKEQGKLASKLLAGKGTAADYAAYKTATASVKAQAKILTDAQEEIKRRQMLYQMRQEETGLLSQQQNIMNQIANAAKQAQEAAAKVGAGGAGGLEDMKTAAAGIEESMKSAFGFMSDPNIAGNITEQTAKVKESFAPFIADMKKIKDEGGIWNWLFGETQTPLKVDPSTYGDAMFNAPEAQSRVQIWLSGITNTITGWANSASTIQTMTNVGTSIWKFILDSFQIVIDAVGGFANWVSKIIGPTENLVSVLLPVGEALGKGILGGIKSSIDKADKVALFSPIGKAIEGVVKYTPAGAGLWVKDWLKEMAPKPEDMTAWQDAGGDMMGGLGLGITTNIPLAKTAVTTAASGVNTAWQTAEQQHSPSLVWSEFGQGLIQGLIDGAMSLQPALLAMIGALTIELNLLITDGFNALVTELTTVVAPAIDAIIQFQLGPMLNIVWAIQDAARDAARAMSDLADAETKLNQATAPSPTVPKMQGGGWAKEGLAYLHENEFVLSQHMLKGMQEIPANVLSPAAMSNLLRTMNVPVTPGQVAIASRPMAVSDVGGKTIQVGPNYISNGMDLAELESRIRVTVNRML